MSEPSIFENLYQEELYLLPPRTIVLINKPWTDLSEDERNLLTKILSSVKLSLASVQILHRSSVSATDLLSMEPKKVISFGVPVSPIQKMYEGIPLDGMSIIVSDALASLDDGKKKNLWLGLRPMFGV